MAQVVHVSGIGLLLSYAGHLFPTFHTFNLNLFLPCQISFFRNTLSVPSRFLSAKAEGMANGVSGAPLKKFLNF